MNFKPKWQFWSTTQPPETNYSYITAIAFTSYPSPIDTAFNGYFFFFLANSSIVEVGSEPADSKYKRGSKVDDDYQTLSIGYEIGDVNSLPKIYRIKLELETNVLSSLIHLTKLTYNNDPISFSAKILS